LIYFDLSLYRSASGMGFLGGLDISVGESIYLSVIW
jgi:hypothetical protein